MLSILAAIEKGQDTNYAIRRQIWLLNKCIYSGEADQFYCFSNIPIYSDDNGKKFNFSIRDLLATDWECSNILDYHGNNYTIKHTINIDEKEFVITDKTYHDILSVIIHDYT